MTDRIKEAAFYHTKIKEWPEKERPREKLLARGPRSLSDAELLALLIESGTGGVTALDVAKRLLVEHEHLAGLAVKGAAELGRMKGIGPARSARILAAFEMGRRVEGGVPRRRVKLESPEEAVRLMRPGFRGLRSEVFKALLLDSGNKVIRDVVISRGTLNASVVHPREVFKTAVDHLAAGVILLHNHPSGECSPSVEDKKVTEQMSQAGDLMGIPVLDHIIVTDDSFFSFAREGYLKQ